MVSSNIVDEMVKGFTSDLGAQDRKLVIGSHGLERTGKSHFCATAPDPIGVIPLDRNTRWTMAKVAKEYGKKVIFPKHDFIRQDAAKLRRISHMEPDAAVKAAKLHYRAHLDAIKDALYALYESDKVRTVIIDTGTQLWEDTVFAHYGRYHRIMPRDRGEPNQEMADLLTACPHNMIITHRSTEIWKNDKPTGRMKCGGWTHVAYYCNVMVEHLKVKKKGEATEFKIRVYDCTANPDLMGGEEEKAVLHGEECDFAELAMRVYPESSLEEWM